MQADPARRVVATDAALAEIERLRAEHGPLMFFQSGGCCDGSSPMCFPDGELLLGPQRAEATQKRESDVTCEGATSRSGGYAVGMRGLQTNVSETV